jgi:SAM-dependent methyltransferase
MKILDIGCGNHKVSGAIGLDNFKLKGVDIVHNLNKIPYPFKDNSFDLIFANNVLEHLTSDLDDIMVELSRICKSSGKIVIEVPNAPSIGAFADPTHKKFFSYRTFDYFGSNEQSYYTKARLKILKIKLIINHGKLGRFFFKPLEILLNFQQKIYLIFPNIFPITALKFELQPVKN